MASYSCDSPVLPHFRAFDQSGERMPDLKSFRSTLPEDCDVLLSHCSQKRFVLNVEFLKKKKMEKKQENTCLREPEASAVPQPPSNNESHTQQVLRDVKNTASKRLSNMKVTFEYWSERLRSSFRGRHRITLTNRYEQIEYQKENRTPVKLYSPFGIETPSPKKCGNGKLSPLDTTPKRPSFVSPTRRFHMDVKDVSNGIRELNKLAANINNNRRRK